LKDNILFFKEGAEMTTQFERKMASNERFKRKAIEIANFAVPIIEQDKAKHGVLLCEGNENSMDVFLYSTVYPEFLVVSVGGCSDIRRLMPFMKKYFEYPCFGLIDRDNCSKNTIRQLKKERNIYCTKLPFIENILCCPEVLKIISKKCRKDYYQILRDVRNGFTWLLVEKMSLLSPFNIDLLGDNEVKVISISFQTNSSIVHTKIINLANVMYTFRNKAIVGLVADAMDFHGCDAYYKFLKQQVRGPDGEKIIQAMAKYLPEIQYDDD